MLSRNIDVCCILQVPDCPDRSSFRSLCYVHAPCIMYRAPTIIYKSAPSHTGVPRENSLGNFCNSNSSASVDPAPTDCDAFDASEIVCSFALRESTKSESIPENVVESAVRLGDLNFRVTRLRFCPKGVVPDDGSVLCIVVAFSWMKNARSSSVRRFTIIQTSLTYVQYGRNTYSLLPTHMIVGLQ